MIRLASVLFVGALLASQALANQALAKPGTPGPAWFTGTYERVGRGSGPDAPMLNDIVSVIPYGEGLAITSCQGLDTILSFGPAFEIVNLLSGSRGGVPMDCLFHKDGNIRPILTCRGEDGAAFALWIRPKSETAGCAP